MDFNATFLRLANEERQRIISRRNTLRAGEVAAPGLDSRGIKRIAFGTNLNHQRVEPAATRRIQKANDLRFLRLHRKTLTRRKVDIVNAGDPGTPEIVGRREDRQQNNGKQQSFSHQ